MITLNYHPGQSVVYKYVTVQISTLTDVAQAAMMKTFTLQQLFVDITGKLGIVVNKSML